LNKIFKVYPNAITKKTENNNDTTLYCYLLSSKTSTNQEIKKTVTFLVQKNIDALIVQNNNGWYPVHIAAYHSLPIDIINYGKQCTGNNHSNSRLTGLLKQIKESTLNDNINYISMHYSFHYSYD